VLLGVTKRNQLDAATSRVAPEFPQIQRCLDQAVGLPRRFLAGGRTGVMARAFRSAPSVCPLCSSNKAGRSTRSQLARLLAERSCSKQSSVSPELVKEMRNTAEGFDVMLQSMQRAGEESLADYLAEAGIDRETFIAAFDEWLSEIQTEVFCDLKNYPDSSLRDRIGRIRRKLTLGGMVAAKSFARELEG